MDIEDLLNTKSPRAAAAQRSATHQMSQTQMAPSSYRLPETEVPPYYQGHDQHPSAQHGQPYPVYPPPSHLDSPYNRSQSHQGHPSVPLGHQNNPPMPPGSLPPPPHRPHMSSADGSISGENSEMPKAFSCETCNKGFARRSDLVRHERIHSGIRPHACPFPNCGKQFIQRSALTVHERVHTREKPHLCDKCSKPFSDSSSLARHRRIHSGTRPYKCPHADCQKTFTRRTTLTRHMNHHTGTVEESEAARAAALASHAQGHAAEISPVDGPDDQSDASSSVASHPTMALPSNISRSHPYPQHQAQDYYSQGPSMPAPHQVKDEMHRYPPPPQPQMLSPQSHGSSASQLRGPSFAGHSPPAGPHGLRNPMAGRYESSHPDSQYANPRESYSYQEPRHPNYNPNMYHR